MATNPLYIRLAELVRLHAIPGDTLAWQCGDHRIAQHFRRQEPRASADLHWDLDASTFVHLAENGGIKGVGIWRQ